MTISKRAIRPVFVFALPPKRNVWCTHTEHGATRVIQDHSKAVGSHRLAGTLGIGATARGVR
jgi:hypothetical protein